MSCLCQSNRVESSHICLLLLQVEPHPAVWRWPQKLSCHKCHLSTTQACHRAPLKQTGGRKESVSLTANDKIGSSHSFQSFADPSKVILHLRYFVRSLLFRSGFSQKWLHTLADQNVSPRKDYYVLLVIPQQVPKYFLTAVCCSYQVSEASSVRQGSTRPRSGCSSTRI